MRSKWWFKGIAIIVILVMASWIAHHLLFTRNGIKITDVTVTQLSEYLQSFGLIAYVIGIVAILIQTFVPFIPFFVIASANVIVFGLFQGFLINYLAACLGAVIAFLVARYIGHAAVERQLTKYPLAKSFNSKLERHGFFYVLMGRLIPIIPSSLVNLASGVTKVRFKHYFFGTIIGKLPLVLLESYIGNDLLHFKENSGRLIVLTFILFVLMGIGYWIKRRLTEKISIK